MKPKPGNTSFFELARVLLRGALTLILTTSPLLHASTLWTGPCTNFVQFQFSSEDDLVPGVSLSRNVNGPLFNPAAGELGSDFFNSPTDTEWAIGTLDDLDSGTLTFQPFPDFRDGDLAGTLLNNPMVLHLISEDIYISVQFTQWGQHGVGGFAYMRTTPAVAVAPMVNIITPASGTVFAAPASLHLSASASDAVTNVQYFAGTALLGTATVAPFGVTGSSLGAGSYSITAVATAGGLTATSPAVNITVVAPVAVSLSSPHVRSNQFIFSYTANPGIAYVIQSSTNLNHWSSLVTNIAASNPVLFTNSFSPNSNLYYRVGRLPNP